MNLDQLWADATAELKASLTTTQIQQSMTKESSNQIAELTKRLGYQRNYAIGFIGLFLVGMIVWSDRALAVQALALATALYVAGGLVLHVGVRRLQRYASSLPERLAKGTVTPIESLRSELRIVQQTLRVNNLWGTVSLPLLILIGLALRYARHTDLTVAELLATPEYLRNAVLCLAIAIPATAVLVHFMNRSAFGSLLEPLKANVEALERLNEVKV